MHEQKVELAGRIARAFADAGDVALVGSVAAGQDDGWSDVEAAVFWRALPAEALAIERVRELGGAHVETLPYGEDAREEGYEAVFWLDGVKVDVQHWPCAAVERRIARVLWGGDARPESQIFLASLQGARALRGGAGLEAWQRQLARYPDALRQRMIEDNLVFLPKQAIEMHAARGDWILFWGNLIGMHKRLLLALCGLNRAYFPGYKRAAALADRLPLRPDRLAERMRAQPGLPAPAAARELIALVEEVLDLLARHEPSQAVSAAREGFSRPRARL